MEKIQINHSPAIAGYQSATSLANVADTTKRRVTILSHPGYNYRYVITDTTTGRLLDDAQEYGYRTFDSAARYAKAHAWAIDNETKIESNSLF